MKRTLAVCLAGGAALAAALVPSASAEASPPAPDSTSAASVFAGAGVSTTDPNAAGGYIGAGNSKGTGSDASTVPSGSGGRAKPSHSWTDGVGSLSPDSHFHNGPGGQEFHDRGYTHYREYEGFLEDTCDFTNSTGALTWWGTKPYNPTAINPIMSWSGSGYQTSVSISSSPSGSITRTSSSITWRPGSVRNNSDATMSYASKVSIHAGWLSNVYYSVGGDWQFGSSFYHNEATS